MAETVIVFDFDKTIIETDSDNWVVDELGATALFNELLPTMPWNSLMDVMMRELHAQGKNIEEIKNVLKRVPIHPRIVPAIKSAYALGCDLRIVSDANTFFIETIIDHLGIKNCFSEINTNPGYVDDEGHLRIRPFVDFHSCPHTCPPNMCKGMIIERIQESLAKEGEKRMIYLGDGINDFCPSLKLREGDFMMPRKGFPVWDLICENRAILRCDIHEWSDGKDMENIMLRLIEKIKIQESSQLLSSSSEHCMFEIVAMPVHEALPPLRVTH
ncbi:Inorganic pyrophosphatase 1 [Castilleja foliolosa]|uniref:Inorganic pyrophosphatase 1 n=1 Tax=Castilleja foliolosa TaxID=1961234 RepID=A0ABD3CPU5_9LAMI